METEEKFLAQHAQTKITVEKLDELMDFAMNPKGLRFSWLIHIVKLISVFLYLYCRKQLLKETWTISVQRYEQDMVNNNRAEVEDDLG